MILTPTYHVFEMFKAHQDARSLPLSIESDTYTMGEKSLPAFTASASQAGSGEILLTIANLKPDETLTIVCELDKALSNVKGRILQADAINAHNSFEAPERVKPSEFTGAKRQEDALTVTLPAASVLALTLS